MAGRRPQGDSHQLSHPPRATRHVGREPNTPRAHLLQPKPPGTQPQEPDTINTPVKPSVACLSRGAGKARSPGSEGALAQQCAGATRQQLLCQVCTGSAVDRETGRIWWLLSGDGRDGDGYTNAPPTCPACIPEAISQCSHLRRNAAVFTVGDCSPFGVRADVFVPYLPPVVPFERNAVLRFDEYDMHHVVARELLMRLHDLQPAMTEVMCHRQPWCQ